MPPPYQTTQADVVGPLQSFPIAGAFGECIDLNQKNTYWCFIEEEQKIFRMTIDIHNPIDYNMAVAGYCGIRLVTYRGVSYTTLSMSIVKAKKGQETPEQAYDRAMAVIGRR